MTNAGQAARLPSIRRRLASALAAWSVVWGLAVGAAVWLAAAHEVDELLDDALASSGELLAVLADAAPRAADPAGVVAAGNGNGNGAGVERFAWQVTAADGTLLLRSRRAPEQPWHRVPPTGFADSGDWRLYGLATGSEGRMLVVAQTKAERREARSEVALDAVLAAFALGLLGHAWLRSRVKRELEPLQALSQRLEAWDVDAADALAPGVLGTAERRELEPVHRALGNVTQRLSTRVANEQAFSAHAAHALRTPLAGIDAQLAVALRDVPAPWHERIQRARDAAAKLQAVVGALLGLFRSGTQSAPSEIDVGELVHRMPAPRLRVSVAAGLHVRADADLMAAGLMNLIDNAQRHGAQHVWIEPVEGGGVRVRDDGPGVAAERRAALQAALDAQRYEGTTGLGLMLADRVARAHGGRLRLPVVARGFAVDFVLS